MDKDWQYFISNVGTNIQGNNRELSFCQYTVIQNQILEIKDTTKDERFKDHVLVANPPHIRYYIGAPLIDDDGLILGTLCGYGLEVNEISDSQKLILTNLARTIVRLIQYRKINKDQEKFVNIFGLTRDLLCVISKDGYFKLVNPAIQKLLGWSKTEILERPVKDFIFSEDKEKVKSEFDSILKGSIEAEFTCRLLTKKGSYIWFSWSYLTNDKSTVIVASGHDMTELLENQESLNKAILVAQKASKVKDEFLSNMSHEIRTPLASIIGYIDLLAATEVNEIQKNYLKISQVASSHLMNLVNDALDSYKLEDGELNLEKKPSYLEGIINKIEKLFGNKAENKGIVFNLEFDNKIPDYVLTDETRLIQILSNLVINAIKFTDKGEVNVKILLVSKSEKIVNVKFIVEDTGIGIEENLLDSIFERFVQEENSTSRIYGGTGLGLSISKYLVELFKGELHVKSKKHQGACFWFEIPLEISKAPDKKSHNKLEKNLTGLKILLAEDNENLQLLCKIHIERLGGDLTIVSNGEDAINAVKFNSFDMLLMDIQMPVMDGLTASSIIRNELKLNIPIVGFSANSAPEEKLRVKQAGMDDFVAKPLKISELIDVIFINSSQKTKEDFAGALEKLAAEEGKELVEEFKKIFNNRVPRDCKELREAYHAKDCESLYKKAHFLTTTFSTLNFQEGVKLTTQIQTDYKKNNTDQVLIKSNQLISFLETALTHINQ